MKKTVILIIAVLIFSGCFSNNVKKEYSEKYSSSGIYSLSVFNENGDVKISSWKKDYIDIKIVKNSWAGKKELEKTEELVELGEEMRIKTKYLKKNPKIKVDYIIRMPYSVKLNSVELGNGDISLEKLQGNITLLSSNGDINADGIEGYLSVETSNGTIEIINSKGIKDLISSNGDINLDIKEFKYDKSMVKTSNGDIKLYLKKESKLYLRARTVNGEIRSEIKDVKKELKGNELEKSFLEGKRELYLKTSNGDIEILKSKVR